MENASGPTDAIEDEQVVKNPAKKVQQCAVCRFDLSGQESYYIGEYHLMALRCPECGQQQPAGIVAQPWKYRRLKYTMMSTAWVCLLFASAVGFTIALTAMTQSTVYASLSPYAKEVSRVYMRADTEYMTNEHGRTLNPLYQIQIKWWDEVGKEQVKSATNPLAHVNWLVLTDWLWFLLISPVLAFMYRVLLYKSHWVTQALCIAGPILLAALSIWVYMESEFYYDSVAPIYCAMDAVGYWIAWPTLLIGAGSFLIAYRLVVPVVNRVQPLMPRLPVLFK